MNDFDYEIEAVRVWHNAAVADGWSVEPTYAGGDVNRECRLRRDGFLAHVLTRSERDTSIAVWGPDGLAIRLSGLSYDWQEIQAGLRRCHNCNATDVHTVRYSFAGRCCLACLPEMQRQHEQPGWCD